MRLAWAACLCFVVAVLTLGPVAAEPIKIGEVKTGSTGVVFLAQERGYFAAEGVPAELVYFESSQPIAVAAASGAIDFGMTAPSGGLYNLAAQGAVKIISGGVTEAPGFKSAGYLVSSRAYEAGLRNFKDFAGHSFGVSQIGSTPHYALGLLADKYGFDIHSVRVVALQSIPNVVSALVGGQVESTILTNSPAVEPAVERGDIKRLGWVGDETPWQFNVTFTSTKTADERADTVRRFLRAYLKAAREYHDAFTGSDGKETLGPGSAEQLAIMAKYLGQSLDAVKLGIGYNDADERLDVKDVLHQVEWFKAQGMLKTDAIGADMIDKRYAVPLPEQR